MSLMEELLERRRAAVRVGSQVIVKRPFTEEEAEGVVVERLRNLVVVSCHGEELEYEISEVTPKERAT